MSKHAYPSMLSR